jgi:hypothetical protein
MAETLEVPVSTVTAAADSALATHEVLDDAAHAEIAQTEDEDYKWLTDRLDALQREQTALQSTFQSRFEAMALTLSQNQEQSRLLIESQASMITSLLESVTALSASALLKSIPMNSQNSSLEETPVTVTEVVEEVVPESQEQTPDRSGDGNKRKKLRKI